MREKTILSDLEAQALVDLTVDRLPADPKTVEYFQALWRDKTPADYYREADDSSADPLP